LAVRRDNVASYEAYLRTYPQGRYAAAARAALDGLQTVLTSSAPAVVAANVGGAAAAPAAPPPSVPTLRVPRLGEVFKDCAECPEMVAIPAGRFLMGSARFEANSHRDEGPQRWVNVPRLAIGRFEVTQSQWQAFMGSNPSFFRACGPSCPVENVSWNDAQEFLRRLSQKTGHEYRLPSEAEWEYAARSGTTTAYPWGDQFESGRSNNGVRTVPVGGYPANAFGLHDMHGNVWEWVQEAWHQDYTGAPIDGSAWVTDGDPSRRVLRGGSWYGTPRDLRSASRIRLTPSIRDSNAGFRVVRSY
jgi:formylglycine-generating enzyme required for sulfatase activity